MTPEQLALVQATRALAESVEHGWPEAFVELLRGEARALRYLGVLGLTLAVRLAGVAVLAHLAGPAGGTPAMQLLILLAATGLSFVANYLASKALVFRPPTEVGPSRATPAYYGSLVESMKIVLKPSLA